MVCNVARRLSYYHDEEQLYCSSAGMDNYYPKSISRELKGLLYSNLMKCEFVELMKPAILLRNLIKFVVYVQQVHSGCTCN
jgi:hypothetical protein